MSATSLGLSQCAEVAAGGLAEAEPFTLTSSFLVNGALGDAALVRRRCEYFGAASCGGDALSTFSTADQIILDTDSTWLEFENGIEMPAGTFSTRCHFEVSNPGGGSPVAHLDEVILTAGGIPEGLFADGFESGNTSLWSVSSP